METISQLTAAYRAKTTTPNEVIESAFATIKSNDGAINAFLHTYEKEAMAEAEIATKTLVTAEGSPLCGVPLALKNNILVAGRPATAASKMLADHVALYDATITKRLRAAGAIIIGDTNMDEFAMGGSTENSAFGSTKNPHDISRVPGGSSGGSAAAVAMGAVPAAIGTDTGGSIRQPASYCGLVGFKPTYGAVSRYGIVAMGSSLDQAGPLTNTVADAELLHSVMAGVDPCDNTSITAETYPTPDAKESYTFGVPRAFLADGVDDGVLAAFEKHLTQLIAAGHRVVDISLPLFEAGLAAYYIVMPAEVSSNLARYDGIRYGFSADGADLLAVYEESRAAGFGPEVKRRILLGTHVLSSGYYDAYYGTAERVRQAMRVELDSVFADIDIIVTPTTPTPAFKLGSQTDPISMYKQDIFTVPVNLTGVPALTFPMGLVKNEGSELPVGVQYIGTHGADSQLFAAGKAIYDQSLC